MKNKIFIPVFLFFIFVVSDITGQQLRERWPEQKIKEWYNQQPWFCGFNYIPAYAINYTAMWDRTTFDPVVIDKELSLAKDLGMNSLRAVLQYAVYEDDPEYFLNTLDEFMDICSKHDIKFMPTMFDDCVFGLENDPEVGIQPEPLEGWYAWAWSPSPGHTMVIDESTHHKLEKYVKAVMERFKDDPRIFVWDLYNEPTNGGLGTASLPLLKKVIAWAREVNPSQPITVAVWNNNGVLNEIALKASDIVSFHHYGNKEDLIKKIDNLKKHDRPIINTEWLNRALGSVVPDHIPVFYEEKIGCMLWGLVNGKTQTHLPWGHRPGDPVPKVWQHDLYHGDHTAYDQKEVDMIQEYITKSRNEEYSRKHTY
jgi:hypothetical protein